MRTAGNEKQKEGEEGGGEQGEEPPVDILELIEGKLPTQESVK